MKKTTVFTYATLILLTVFFLGFVSYKPSYAKTYTVTTKTKPCDGTANSKLYNKNTKHYFVLRSYLNKLANSKKGGKLIIKKGVYKISNTLFVGSNTHIVLKNATLKKINKAAPSMPPSTTIFQFINFKYKDKSAVYGKHNGEHDISITGKGTINQNFISPKGSSKAGIAVIMGHNSNVTIDGITFKNNCYGHLIEMDACKNVVLNNCKFIGYKASGKYNKEAVNIDTPDAERDGFNSSWSKKDKTPNEKITIKNCVFKNLESGIGTHRYTGGAYHTDVTIKNNSFTNCQTAVRIINYKNCVLTNNTFKNCKPNKTYPYVMLFAGLRGINFSYNSFVNCGYDANDPADGESHDFTYMLLRLYLDYGYNAGQTTYDPVTSELSEDEAALFLTNTADHCGRVKVMKNCPYPIDFTGHR